MDAAKRWETEAMRESRDRQRSRPSVSKAQQADAALSDWRTLREATEITGIPLGTLRKWCRRETVDSYLESDGELTLRMVEMGSLQARAEALGREQTEPKPAVESPVASRQSPENSGTREPNPVAEPGTMIVPVDAWNKMLNQLGNLHEAGQQLAEARERAAKAETESKFLRERLAEMREVASRQSPVASHQSPVADPPDPPRVSSPSGGGGSGAAADGGGQAAPNDHSAINETAMVAAPVAPNEGAEAETTAFWRYVVRGWRGRRS